MRRSSSSFFCFFAALAVSAGLVYGCGDDDVPATSTTTDGGDAASDSGTTSSSSSGAVDVDAGNDGATEGPPALGAQLDRVGRPLVNLMLNHVFDVDAGARSSARDRYAADSNEASWVATYREEIAKNLALFDGLDTMCGTTIGTDAGADNTTAIARYATLADVLADDRMWIRLDGVDPPDYLAVELDAIAHGDAGVRGGRRLQHDVVDKTLGVLTIDHVDELVIGDGAEFDPSTGPDPGTFPYLVVSP